MSELKVQSRVFQLQSCAQHKMSTEKNFSPLEYPHAYPYQHSRSGYYLSRMRCLWLQGTVQCLLFPAHTHFAGYFITIVFIQHSRIPAVRTANSQQPKPVYMTIADRTYSHDRLQRMEEYLIILNVCFFFFSLLFFFFLFSQEGENTLRGLQQSKEGKG